MGGDLLRKELPHGAYVGDLELRGGASCAHVMSAHTYDGGIRTHHRKCGNQTEACNIMFFRGKNLQVGKGFDQTQAKLTAAGARKVGCSHPNPGAILASLFRLSCDAPRKRGSAER